MWRRLQYCWASDQLNFTLTKTKRWLVLPDENKWWWSGTEGAINVPIYESINTIWAQTVVADKGVSQEAVRVLPHSKTPHLHTHLAPEEVVRLTKIPIPVLALFVPWKWPPPAGEVIVQPDPGHPSEASSGVLNCVHQPVHFLYVGDGGQVSVQLSALRLGPQPGQGGANEVVLTRLAAGKRTQRCWKRTKVQFQGFAE